MIAKKGMSNDIATQLCMELYGLSTEEAKEEVVVTVEHAFGRDPRLAPPWITENEVLLKELRETSTAEPKKAAASKSPAISSIQTLDDFRAAIEHSEATGKLLDNDKSPLRKVKQLDNRGSTFYIARYWAEEMAKHDDTFKALSADLQASEEKIVSELIECQGESVDIGGYWKPDFAKVTEAMRASPTFNKILDNY